MLNDNLLTALFICLGYLAIFFLFYKMTHRAKKRRGAAIAFGLLVQMFLPDPNIQKTIETVVISKQKQKQKAESRKTHSTASTGITTHLNESAVDKQMLASKKQLQ